MSAPSGSPLKVWRCKNCDGLIYATEGGCADLALCRKLGAEEVEVIPVADFKQAADEIANYTNVLHAEEEAHFKTRDERDKAVADFEGFRERLTSALDKEEAECKGVRDSGDYHPVEVREARSALSSLGVIRRAAASENPESTEEGT